MDDVWAECVLMYAAGPSHDPLCMVPECSITPNTAIKARLVFDTVCLMENQHSLCYSAYLMKKSLIIHREKK